MSQQRSLGSQSQERRNWGAVREAVNQIRQENQQILANEVNLQEDEPEEEPEGTIWAELQEEDHCLLSTGFTREEIWNFWCNLQPHMEAQRTRGPKPKISPMDSMLALLMMYKLNWTIGTLAAWMKVKEPTLRGALERIRGPFLEMLRIRWNPERFRPKPLSGNFPFIGLIVDTTSMEVFRPRGRFEEAKIYFDGKNKIYALKKEVGVLAYPPYYALFFQKGRVGSQHDYSIFQGTHEGYAPFLKKTPREQVELGGDRDSRWAIVLDKAYVGPENDTPHVRRLFISKNPRTEAERARNRELSKIRVHIEAWFGRMKNLWKFARDVFSHDHRSFDEHFEIMALLTNENIQAMELGPEDRKYYRSYLKERRNSAEEKEAKRKRQSESSRARKARRLAVFQ